MKAPRNVDHTAGANVGGGFTHDLVIIGAGPAGMTAAATASAYGLRTVLLDEQRRPGGQIYRNVTAAPAAVAELLGPDYRHGTKLAQRFAASGVEVHHNTLVWDVENDLTVYAQQSGRSFHVRAPQLLVATGAMERPSPMPGWTLPGVLNAGAAQIALKTSAQVPDGNVMLVGGGPLLLLVACQLLQAGAKIAGIVDTTPASNRTRALPHLVGALGAPKMLGKGLRMLWNLRRARIPVWKQCTGVRIEGDERVQAVSFTVGSATCRIAADTVLLHHGVVPNTQISRLLRVKHDWSDEQLAWQPVLDDWGQTSLPGFRMAGDGAAIAGALAAEASGAIAAIGAAAALGKFDMTRAEHLAGPWRARLASQRPIRPFLDALYRPPEWLTDCADETVVCRCEEVTAGNVREMARLGCEGPNQTKFFSRCGMGPCQGRMCGITVTQVLAKALNRTPVEVGAYRIRAPLKPVSLGSVAALAQPTKPVDSTSKQ
ncbi:opine oxidase subunit A (plasmid) [Cupriavidus necator N-1]|uniref:Opine oxidase subunit A n=1 Tax=Cupriavidus necator (strain ATCC 43291 / DSM 13513 / CCUG 52238 / LMG 8453 / N-1) TaxID=1042878 RepID=F8GY19_CUPNN|nr:NAD(P)/FAD-dependent oxidoreductase [Cupriavidus necator]AEI83143.1 opine oxidase subunit A [Cupriavidus necator N-1]MDX6008550.1 NAD(P)/FAD-dependent oxidoreductase [Cupriavidus necator]